MVRTLIRVCHVIHDLRRGGAEHLLVDLAGAAGGARLEMSVVSLMPTAGHAYAAALRDAGVVLHDLDLRSRWDPRSAGRLRRVLGDIQPDVVHSHLKHADLVAAKVAPALGIPMVSSLHLIENQVGLIGKLKRWAGLRARRRADRVVAVSEAVRDWYLGLSGAAPEIVITLHNGVAAPSPPAAGHRYMVRTDLGVPSDAVLAATVAVLRPGKGIDDLLSAATRLTEHDELWFVIAGSGPEEERLRLEAAGLGLERVVFAGFVEDVGSLLAAADLLVHPSHFDALATALIHGMAAGLPMVATAVGGTPELLDDEIGMLVPAADPVTLAAAIGSLVSDPDSRRMMGKRARHRFEEQFDIAGWADRLHDLYEQVLAER